jgi:hypothetical protein
MMKRVLKGLATLTALAVLALGGFVCVEVRTFDSSMAKTGAGIDTPTARSPA